MFIFRGILVDSQLLLWRFIHHLPSHTKLSQITSSQPCKHAVASRNLIRQFLARFTGPLPSKYTLAFAHSFAKLSRKYPYPQTPGGKHQGVVVWFSQSLTFGSFAAAFGACFLRLQNATLGSTSGRCKAARLCFKTIHNIQLSRNFRE